MKLLLDGSLDQKLQLKDLLSGISQAEAPGLTVLKFKAENEERGEIFFLGGHYIVYARLNTNNLTGKPALDELLQAKKAEFVYYACDSVEALPQESDNLRIDLKGLLDDWKEIKPVSEGELLDKIFNTIVPPPENAKDISPSIAIAEPIEAAPKKAEINSGWDDVQTGHSNIVATPPPRDDVDWGVVVPLVSNGAPGSGTDSSEYAAAGEQTPPHDLRTLWRGFHWQRGMRALFLFILIFLVFCIIAASVIWLYINAPSLHLSPKRYVIQQKHNYHRPQ